MQPCRAGSWLAGQVPWNWALFPSNSQMACMQPQGPEADTLKSGRISPAAIGWHATSEHEKPNSQMAHTKPVAHAPSATCIQLSLLLHTPHCTAVDCTCSSNDARPKNKPAKPPQKTACKANKQPYPSWSHGSRRRRHSTRNSCAG
jgi:hypothetical protein